MATSYDAVIIGSGHNGLVAACYLALAGKKVLILEKNEVIGGATTSVQAFDGVPARLSRYSYLVALLPDQIIQDLSLNFKTLSRTVSSYTPYFDDDGDKGVLINRSLDEETLSSLRTLTGSDDESIAWKNFYESVLGLDRWAHRNLYQRQRSRSKYLLYLPSHRKWNGGVESPRRWNGDSC